MPENRFQHHLAAILAADVVGFGWLMVAYENDVPLDDMPRKRLHFHEAAATELQVSNDPSSV